MQRTMERNSFFFIMADTVLVIFKSSVFKSKHFCRDYYFCRPISNRKGFDLYLEKSRLKVYRMCCSFTESVSVYALPDR
jgi:hypothetical protein